MDLVKRGAEADIYLLNWGDGNIPAIMKTRKAKGYRHPDLDNKIRRQRTIHESQIISEAKSFGVATPLIYFLDIKKYEIIMQYVVGTPVHDLSESKIIFSCKQIGKIVGLLHKNGIMHGDLTTSNFISTKNKIYVIDFGLAMKTRKPEDHAVDLRLFKEILNSAHAKIMQKSWNNFLQGYKTVVGPKYLSKILDLVSIIESRGRYATVV